MDDLTAVASNLVRDASGLWFTGQQAQVSYPEGAHAACLQIEEESFWFRHRNRCITHLVGQYAIGDVLFDIGGGNGFVSKGLQSEGIDCVLVEPGIAGARAAQARGVERIICARLEDIEFEPASMASMGLFDVLEHIEDSVAILSHLHRLLKPGGRLFLTVPAYPFLFSSEDTVAGHFRRYTLSSLRHELDAAGFNLTFGSYIFAPLPPLIFMLRTVPTWLGLRQGMDTGREAAEHRPKRASASLMDSMLDAEFRRLAKGYAIPFGGSCICVATKR